MTAVRFFLFALSCTLAAVVHPAEPPGRGASADVVESLVATGRLRLQAQRLAKLYLQSGLGLGSPATVRASQQAIGEAEAALAGLARQARAAPVQHSLQRCAGLWRELRGIAGQPYAAPSAERLAQLTEELSLQSGKLALQVEAEAETPLARLLDQSSRLNMLSQRLARLYLQALAGDRSAGRLVDLEQTRREFVTGLAELESAPLNSRATQESLALARNQWIFFEAALAQLQQPRSDGRAPLHVATTSERILEALDVVAAQYAQDFAAPPPRARR